MRADDELLASVTSAAITSIGGLVIGSPTLVVGPWLVAVAWRRSRRSAAVDADDRLLHAALPPFLDALAQRLAAGSSLRQALQETPAPPALATRLRPMTVGLSLGLGLDASIRALRPHPAPDPARSAALELMVDTLGLLVTSGGPALPSVERLNDTIRSAARVDDEVRVNAGQATASAALLAALPFLFAAGLATLDPRLAHLYLYEPMGAACLAVAFGLSWGGWRWMGHLARPRHHRPPVTAPVRPRSVAGPTAAITVGIALLVSPVVAFGFGVSVAVAVHVANGRRAAAERQALAGELPEAIDLCTVVLGAGGTIADCVAALATSGPRRVRVSATEAARRTERGHRLDQALRWMQHDLGPSFQPLTGALLLAREQGGGIGELLARLAVEASTSRRRLGELRARQLPVALLIPLVTCSLPAVIVGAVVPLATVALDGVDVGRPPVSSTP